MVDIVNAGIGILQLVIAILVAVLALYIGIYVLGWITKGIDEEKELMKGNVAVGILVASVFIAIGFVVQSGVTGISKGLSKAWNVGFMSEEGILVIVLSILQLLLGIVLAIVAIYIALWILDKLTKEIEEFEELKKGNVAVALEMAGVIITVAVIIQSGVAGITSALI